MISIFSGRTADEAWQKVAKTFRKGTIPKNHISRAGNTREILHVGFSIENPLQRWVVSRFPAMNPAFAIAEIVWIVTGRRDSAFLNYWNKQLPKYAGSGKTYHGAYGYRLRHHFGLDQLTRAYIALSKKAYSRQIVLQIWDSQIDFPHTNGNPVSKDVPCNICSLLQIRDGKLEWMQIIRSNDLFLGVPHNFVQFTYLQEILAGWMNVEVGQYNQISNSLHVYERDSKFVDDSKPMSVAENTDSVAINRKLSESLFHELGKRVDILSNRGGVSEQKLRQIAVWSDAPVAFQNMLYILAAESSWRRKQPELSKEIMVRCSNPVFIQLWDRWIDRISKQGPKPNRQNL